MNNKVYYPYKKPQSFNKLFHVNGISFLRLIDNVQKICLSSLIQTVVSLCHQRLAALRIVGSRPMATPQRKAQCIIQYGLQQAVRSIVRWNIRLEYDRDAPTVRHFGHGQRHTFKWTKSVSQRKSPKIGCVRLKKTVEAQTSIHDVNHRI